MPSSSSDQLRRGLSDPSAYPHPVEGPVEIYETHISRVFLAGCYAYKTKKACVTEFLDYGTLEARRAACQQELRLNRRYAPELYLAVVPITRLASRFQVGPGDESRGPHEERGETVEYAVKMHRFPDDALLKERLRRGRLTSEEVRQLAQAVAAFHSAAERADPERPSSESPWGSPERVGADAMANFTALRASGIDALEPQLSAVERWTRDFFEAEAPQFRERIAAGWIRECHGDLHLANVIHWRDRLMPFDGIEFNEGFRWIDVLSDAAFLAMDLAACGHLELSRRFTNDYLDQTGDRGSLQLWRWYLVYRAMVRGKIAAMRAEQPEMTAEEQAEAVEDCRDHIALAEQFTRPEPRCLWITHGLSGSGKTTGSELIVERHGAIRVRSDVERKRALGLPSTHRPDRRQAAELYGERARQVTYDQLHRIAREVLRGGFSVIVDATFLKADQRQRFAELADREGVRFAILDFPADAATLRQRVAARQAAGGDASDAGLEVLEKQIASEQPLTAAERAFVVTIPIESL